MKEMVQSVREAEERKYLPLRLDRKASSWQLIFLTRRQKQHGKSVCLPPFRTKVKHTIVQ